MIEASVSGVEPPGAKLDNLPESNEALEGPRPALAGKGLKKSRAD